MFVAECEKTISALNANYIQLSKLYNFHKHTQKYKCLLNILGESQTVEEEPAKEKDLLEIVKSVDIQFGKMFSKVLPGARACLRQVDPNDITAGLKISVKCNGSWNDNLNDFSNRKRSIAALSLIIATSSLNTVPCHILHRVDAALNRNHVLKFGEILKTNFKQCQFIVVPFKNYKYNHTSVSFKTGFDDGYSTVSRTTPKQT